MKCERYEKLEKSTFFKVFFCQNIIIFIYSLVVTRDITKCSFFSIIWDNVHIKQEEIWWKFTSLMTTKLKFEIHYEALHYFVCKVSIEISGVKQK